MKLYLAHPINGLSYEEVMAYYEKAVEDLEFYFEILHPMIGKDYLRTEKVLRAEGYGQPCSTNHAIVERDKWMVSSADIVYANLMLATNVSIGTVSELAWASLLGKHTLLALPAESPHRHAFVLEMADIVFPSHDDVVQYLYDLGGQTGGA